MSFSLAYCVPEKPIGDEDDKFERDQEYHRLNPTAHIHAPIGEMSDPGEQFMDEILEVEQTAPDLDTRKKVTEFLTNGQYDHVHPSLQEKRLRKIEELEISEAAAAEVKETFAAMRRAAYERTLLPPQEQMVE